MLVDGCHHGLQILCASCLHVPFYYVTNACMHATANTCHRSIIGLKAKAGFKATEKSGGNAINSIKRAGAAMMAQLSVRNSGQLPLHMQPTAE